MVFLDIQFFCFIFVVTSVAENKKYDVESEAQKFYGENLGAVLLRFRKTSDYLKILSEKVNDLQNELADVRVHIMAHYEVNLKNEIKEIFGLNTVTPTEPTTPLSPDLKKATRQEETELDEATRQKIKRIDSYKLLNSSLTVKERNEFKDLGFQYVGQVIHSIIEKMAVDCAGGVQSTLMEGKVSTDALRVTKKRETATMESVEDKTRFRRQKYRRY